VTALRIVDSYNSLRASSTLLGRPYW